MPNLRNPAQFTVTSITSRSSKVIDVGANQKRICSFLLIINSNFGRIYRFRHIDTFSSYLVFTIPPLFDAAYSGETPCDINIIYTLLESTFNGQQFRRWQSVFIHLAIVGSQICEIWWNSEREFDLVNSSWSSKVIDLGVNRKRIMRLPVSH